MGTIYSLSDQLRDRCEEVGIPLRLVAKAAGLPASTPHRWGKGAEPSLKTAEKLWRTLEAFEEVKTLWLTEAPREPVIEPVEVPEARPVWRGNGGVVYLTEVGDKKINVIKEVRAITGLGLKDAKDLVESAPCPVHSPLLSDQQIKEVLEDAGAAVELAA